MKTRYFQHKKMTVAIALAIVGGFNQSSLAQGQDSAIEEIVVLGVKGAQQTAVNIKRDATSIVDSISAEDIGKLPDATISDSLQRVPGIQIRRVAGEGSQVNVRGLPQVSSLLNGESYLGANSITNFQPNFGDIPSSLFKGADIIKSPTGQLLNSGISGTINLKTRRPFDFTEGFSGGAAIETQYGLDSAKNDPSANALLNWKNDSIGVLLAGSYSRFNLANYYEGAQYGQGTGAMVVSGEGHTNPNGFVVLGNNDGDFNDRFMGPEGFSNYNSFNERERKGLNLSVQADLGEGFELIADYFYTHQDDYNRATGVVAENKWSSFDYFTAVESRETGDGNFLSIQNYETALRRVQSYSQVGEIFSQSQDFNLELHYDNGGPLTASTRLVRGNASQHNLNNYFQGDLMDGYAGNTAIVTSNTNGNRIPGQWVNPNPNGFSGLAHFNIIHKGDRPEWTGWDNRPIAKGTGAPVDSSGLIDYINDPAAYNTAAISSENNFDREGRLSVLRSDISYKFNEGFFTSIDAGYRISEKIASDQVWHGLSQFYAGKGGVTSDGTPNPEGCLARWKATDVTFNGDCQVGEMVDGSWVPWTAIGYVPQSDFKTIKVNDFGNTKGMPTFYTVDPRALEDVAAFHTKFYGNFIKSIDPGQSYDVKLGEKSFYLQGNFAINALSGNLGVRVIETDLSVKQNVVGGSRSYGMAAVDAGDKLTNRRYRDVLPAFNLTYDVTDDIKLRAAYSKNMVPLNLTQWGQALVTNYAFSDGVQRISRVTYNGNPELNPWRASTAEISAEWYTAPGSLLSIALFDLKVDSFPATANTFEPFPDLDGVTRNQSVPTQKQLPGKGGNIRGLEIGAKQSFDFLPGVWSHFGVDANLTLTSSENPGVIDIKGKHPAFNDNSKSQYNLVLWYQDEALQARLAYNYRGDRVTGQFLGVGDNKNLVEYQSPTRYLDASLSYDVSDAWTVYVNASNITGEHERYYLQWTDQYTSENVYESRYTVGLRMRF